MDRRLVRPELLQDCAAERSARPVQRRHQGHAWRLVAQARNQLADDRSGLGRHGQPPERHRLSLRKGCLLNGPHRIGAETGPVVRVLKNSESWAAEDGSRASNATPNASFSDQRTMACEITTGAAWPGRQI